MENPGPSPLSDETVTLGRILLVDDDRVTRRLNAAMLVCSGFRVDEVENGAQGWDLLQIGKYDLLITDNSMPLVTGVEMINLLRSRNMCLPVIMASGAIPTEELVRHPRLRISAILVRPYTLLELLQTVKEVLRLDGPPD